MATTPKYDEQSEVRPDVGDDDVAEDVGADEVTGTDDLDERPASPSEIEHVDRSTGRP
ncbi:MAG: hypothetical protein QM639_20515 [Rhodocyclaceae bacterium]